jgi:hypothetical protein
MLHSRRESLHHNGITDLDLLQQTSATKSANTRQCTGQSRKFDGLGVPNFNLASAFANWDPNFVELLRVQSVGAIIPWRD